MAANLIWACQIYLGIGAVVAAAFLVVGIGRIDENARGVWVFRPFLIPGILLIWPLVLVRWAQMERSGDMGHKRFRPPLALQPRIALGMALAIAVVISGAMVLRQDGPIEAAAELLEPPQ